MILFVATAKPV